MTKTKCVDGKAFKRMFAAGTRWLERAVPEINAINVFPVPDGDTGTNMLLTMRSAVEEANGANGPVGEITRSMAYGALMGARGNSGVILSQLWRGIADALEGKDALDGSDLATALQKASDTVYSGLVHPVEGTILTVLRDAAEAARETVNLDPEADLTTVLESAVQAARISVAKTPELLPVLKEAGVVDAGAQGLYVLLDGALTFLNGTKEQKNGGPDLVASNIEPMQQATHATTSQIEVPYGYCTNFVLEAKSLDIERLRRKLHRKGQSLVIGTDGGTSSETSLVRVHLHTFKPGEVLDIATKLGTLHQIEIHNMDDQYEEFIKLQRSRLPQVETAIVTIASGEGLHEVFTSLGATIVVPGGQAMNPSVKQLLQAVDHAPSDHVILLPNNKNIVSTAAQVHALSQKNVHVVPSRTVPQGIAALLAFNYDLTAEENARAMTEALESVTTIEITRAARKTQLNGEKIKKGQFIAIRDGKNLIASGDSVEEAVSRALELSGIADAELVTLYSGVEIDAAAADALARLIRERHGVEVELVVGGQPHYDYIISVE